MLDEVLGVDRPRRCRRSSVPRPRWLCVASGTSSRMRSTSPSREPGLEQALCRASAHEPLRARAGVDADRLDADDAATSRRSSGGDAAAIAIICVSADRSRASGRSRDTAPRSTSRRAARAGDRRCVVAMCSASFSTQEGLADHDLVDRLPKLGKAGHVHALLAGSRSTRSRSPRSRLVAPSSLERGSPSGHALDPGRVR